MDIKTITKGMRYKEALLFLRGESHLDLGCGNGEFLKMSPCKIKIGLDKLNGNFIKNRLDFDSESFDNVTMLATISYLECRKEILKECYRILKNGGTLIITEPAPIAKCLIRMYDDYPNEILPTNDLRNMMIGAGFKIVECKKFMFGMNRIIVGEK